MNHEPECHMDFEYEFGCHCEEFRAAYKRGREDAAQAIMRLIVNNPKRTSTFLAASLSDTMAAARGGELQIGDATTTNLGTLGGEQE